MFRVIGRVFLSAIFLLFAISSLINWDIAYTDLDTALVNWQMYSANSASIGSFVDTLLEYVGVILGVGLFLELVGALLVFFGYRAKVGASFLAIYLFFSTLLFFPFWFYEGEQLSLNLVAFLKNVSIMGGIFLLLGRGSPRRSISMMDGEV